MAYDQAAMDRALAVVDDSSEQELSILRIAEPLLTLSQREHDNTEKSAGAATHNTDAPTPASLNADLEHYKELFTKLRFSYVEQVTKEKFLRAVVGDPPLYVDQNENAEVEAELSDVKALLKVQKAEGVALTEELERQGRELGSRYRTVQSKADELRELPERNAELRQTIAHLQSQQTSSSENPVMTLPLAATQAVVSDVESELTELDAQLRILQAELLRDGAHLENLEHNLQHLEAERIQATTAAESAKRNHEQGLGGFGDDLEAKGRWLKAVEATMHHLVPASAS